MISLVVSGSRARVADLVALTKPRITAMVTATGVAGVLAAPTRPSMPQTLVVAAGIGLVVASANVVNMWLERESDALMERTRARPLAAGRVSPGVGLGLGLALLAAAIPTMLASSLRVAGLGLVAWFAYVALYTPLKRWTAWSLPVGAVAGAMPPAMGSVAATGALDARAGYLFAVLFAWQLPHFLAISIMRADEYRGAGLAVGARLGTRVVLVSSATALWIVTLASPAFGLGAWGAGAVAAVSGGAMLLLSLRAARPGAGRAEARDVFAFTMAHLALVLTAFGVDRG